MGRATAATEQHDHERLLNEALRAPSAHNAQPWRLVPCADDAYELHYDHVDYLPHDPDDRDAYLAMGAFYETLVLAAARDRYVCSFEARFERTGTDLFVGVVRIAAAPSGFQADPLAAVVGDRLTNRRPYRRAPLPAALAAELVATGCVFVAPRAVVPILRDASVASWMDRQFVKDLKRWMRFHDDDAPDGMTPVALALGPLDRAGLRVALWLGRLRRPVARVYAHRDIALAKASSTVAVIGAPSLQPSDLFDAGRRLLRAWTTATAAGYSTHPLSIVIDRPETAPRLAVSSGVPVPVALFRVGYTARGVPRSNRRPLHAVLTRPGRERSDYSSG
jgi:hypothetical protein